MLKNKLAQRRNMSQWVGYYIWYSKDIPGWAAAPPSPLLVVPDVTAHASTASVKARQSTRLASKLSHSLQR